MKRFHGLSRLVAALILAPALALAGLGCGDETGGTGGSGGGTGGAGGSGGGTGGAMPAGKGTTTLKFSVSNGVRKSPNLVDPLKGTIYGALYKKQDVSLTGPAEGAMSYASVEVADVDLDSAMESAASWTSGEIEAGTYVFLGFFDVDGNGSVDNEPDPGDPVTLPLSNTIAIEADQETALTAVFELVFN